MSAFAELEREIRDLQGLPLDRLTIHVDFNPVFTRDTGRKPVLVILADSMVTPMKDPYYNRSAFPGVIQWSRVRHSENIEEALEEGSVFLEVIDQIDESSEYVFLLVDSSSFDPFRKVRKILEQRDVPFGWEPVERTRHIGFVSQGGATRGRME